MLKDSRRTLQERKELWENVNKTPDVSFRLAYTKISRMDIWSCSRPKSKLIRNEPLMWMQIVKCQRQKKGKVVETDGFYDD